MLARQWRGTYGVAVLTVLVLLYPGIGLGDDSEEIVRWVAGQMRIQTPYSIPVIQWVNKSELSAVFASGSKGSMARWAASQSPGDADRLMKLYLESAVGMFNPKANIVYVGSFLSPCRQKAILAHEVTHYFQYVIRGPITGEGMAKEMLLMEREMEACAIEQRYEEKFCGDVTLALYWEVTSISEPIYFP